MSVCMCVFIYISLVNMLCMEGIAHHLVHVVCIYIYIYIYIYI